MILLDFDGVIIDSKLEAVITSYRLLTKEKVTKAEQIPKDIMARAVKHRAYARDASHIVTLTAQCIGSTASEFSEEEINEFHAGYSVPARELEARFFHARGEFVKENPKEWAALHQIYTPFVPAISKATQSVVILTSKDKAATVELTRHFNLPISPDRIFGGDNHTSKSKNLFTIAEKFQEQEFVFIDDHVKNLLDVTEDCGEQFDITPLLATWGFASQTQIETARQNNIKIIDQAEGVRVLTS